MNSTDPHREAPPSPAAPGRPEPGRGLLTRPPSMSRAMDLPRAIAAYESDEMDAVEIVQLFQDLVDTGLVWRLPDGYGHTAWTLIDAGLVRMATRPNDL